VHPSCTAWQLVALVLRINWLFINRLELHIVSGAVMHQDFVDFGLTRSCRKRRPDSFYCSMHSMTVSVSLL